MNWRCHQSNLWSYRKCKWKTVTERLGWEPYWVTWLYTARATIRFWTSGIIILNVFLSYFMKKKNCFTFYLPNPRANSNFRTARYRHMRSTGNSVCVFVFFFWNADAKSFWDIFFEAFKMLGGGFFCVCFTNFHRNTFEYKHSYFGFKIKRVSNSRDGAILIKSCNFITIKHLLKK